MAQIDNRLEEHTTISPSIVRILGFGLMGHKRMRNLKLACFLSAQGRDDLRQDAIMQQVFSLVNRLLSCDQAASRRQLHIRTYKVRYLFHPHVTAVARKRSWSFCQKRWWQVAAKHTYTLCMWLCMKWHGAWLFGVHRTCAETAAVSCGTSHASAVSTPLQWILKKNAL